MPRDWFEIPSLELKLFKFFKVKMNRFDTELEVSEFIEKNDNLPLISYDH